ncbi:MAG: hypothetical protein ACLQLC_12635 [Candidatus Sulfotelmatobacter sp.]
MKFRTLAVTLFTMLAFSLFAGSQDVVTPHHRGLAPHAGNPERSERTQPLSSGTWTKIATEPSVSVGAMLLLTDGRVLVHSEPNCSGCTGNYADWYTLTPDSTGSYVNGTWTQVATLPSGYSPLFFGSAVLPDGKVVIEGGEYNCTHGCTGDWQNKGAIYDPAANTWTSLTVPSTKHIGDAESVVLPDGTWMIADCCALAFGDAAFPTYFTFDESTLSFTDIANATDGKNDDFDEEGWTLLPNGNILTVDAYTSNTVLTGTNSETYNSTTNTWTTAGSTIEQLWDSNCEKGSGSYELGPAVLRPDGTVFATGASDCEAGNTAVYNSTTGTWSAGPNFPIADAANDAPAALEIDGDVIVAGSPYSGTFSSPTSIFEWDGTNFTEINAPPNAVNTASYQCHMLELPNGQIMYTDYSTDVEFFTSSGTYESAWQPTITSVPSTLVLGTTYTVSGTQLNGLSLGAAYGDDFQDATNWPIVEVVNSTGAVSFLKTHSFSTMGVATGSAVVSAQFDVPATLATGAYTLYAVTNGIPSAGVPVTVSSTAGTFSISATPKKATIAPGGSTNVKITSTVTGGFDSKITLSASGQPSGVKVSFNPTSITGAGSAAMRIQSTAAAKAGTYTITVTGTSGTTTETTTFTLTIS